MILVILSNKQQYLSLLEKYPMAGKAKILCNNRNFYDFLRKSNVNFQSLDEECLKDEWESINTWACEKALLWSRLIDCKSYFDGIEINEAMYVYFSYYLTALLKNYLLTEYVYREYKPAEVIVFSEAYTPDLFEFNGNYFLNLFLREAGNRYGIKTTSLRLNANPPQKKAISVKETIRNLVKELYWRIPRFGGKKEAFIACGSLKHLEDALKMLRDKDYNVLLYDFEFHTEQFRFCLRHNIRYFIPECFLKTKTKDKTGSFDYRESFIKVTETLRLNKWFRYKDTDLSEFVCDELLNRATQYLKNISAWSSAYHIIINAYDVKALIIDEDWSPIQAFMAAFFKSRGINTFCISHGYGVVRFSLNESMRTFFLSETFVHSEYEKFLYSSRGWNQNHLHVSGIPRYDRLMELKNKKNKQNKIYKKKMKILFCGTSMLDYAPDESSYIGVQYVDGPHMRACLKDIIKAINEYKIELVIKPHDDDEEKLWLDFIRENKKKNNISLVSVKTNFFNLLSQCDAMFLGHWSTAIIESAIFGIPTILLDYTGFEDGHPFAREGLCTVSRSLGELKEIVKELYASFVMNKDSKYLPIDIKSRSFYTGVNDGKNTQRVVEEIISHGD